MNDIKVIYLELCKKCGKKVEFVGPRYDFFSNRLVYSCTECRWTRFRYPMDHPTTPGEETL